MNAAATSEHARKKRVMPAFNGDVSFATGTVISGNDIFFSHTSRSILTYEGLSK